MSDVFDKAKMAQPTSKSLANPASLTAIGESLGDFPDSDGYRVMVFDSGIVIMKSTQAQRLFRQISSRLGSFNLDSSKIGRELELASLALLKIMPLTAPITQTFPKIGETNEISKPNLSLDSVAPDSKPSSSSGVQSLQTSEPAGQDTASGPVDKTGTTPSGSV